MAKYSSSTIHGIHLMYCYNVYVFVANEYVLPNKCGIALKERCVQKENRTKRVRIYSHNFHRAYIYSRIIAPLLIHPSSIFSVSYNYRFLNVWTVPPNGQTDLYEMLAQFRLKTQNCATHRLVYGLLAKPNRSCNLFILLRSMTRQVFASFR